MNESHACERSGDELRLAVILQQNTECEWCGDPSTCVVETRNGEAVSCGYCPSAALENA